MGVARDIVREIAATADGVPLRLRVNPAPRRVASLRANRHAGSNPDFGQAVPKTESLSAGKCRVPPIQCTSDPATRGAGARVGDGLAVYEPCMRVCRRWSLVRARRTTVRAPSPLQLIFSHWIS